MPKKFIQRFMPAPDMIRRQKSLKVFGNLLYNPNLWCLNRRSAAGAFAVGLFICFVPLPSQMLLACGAAIAFGVNLPLSIALVWISNPITMPFMFYFAYKLGAWILHTPDFSFHFELTWQFLHDQLSTIGPPLLVGSLVCGSVLALCGYLGINGLWRYSVVRSWQKRRFRSPLAKKKQNQAITTPSIPSPNKKAA
ncbi:MAG: DUF2062 domain-containing protein [Vibrio sp.]